jgi:hypothetical protein
VQVSDIDQRLSLTIDMTGGVEIVPRGKGNRGNLTARS